MEIKTIVSGELDNNTYVITHNQKAIIIDASCELKDVEKVLGQNKVVALMLTHAHFDHICNLDALINHFGVKCYMYKFAFDKLKDPKLNCSYYFNPLISQLKNQDVVFVENEQVVDVLGIPIKVIYTPGHTNCGLSFVIEDNVFAGDTLFYDGVGRTDLPTSNYKDLEDSLQMLFKNYKNYQLYPGHGKNGTI